MQENFLTGRSYVDQVLAPVVVHMQQLLISILFTCFVSLANAIMRLITHFPAILKEAELAMMNQSGKDTNFAQNHRPIRLLPTISKIAERIDSETKQTKETYFLQNNLDSKKNTSSNLGNAEGTFRNNTSRMLLVDIKSTIWFNINLFTKSFGGYAAASVDVVVYVSTIVLAIRRLMN